MREERDRLESLPYVLKVVIACFLNPRETVLNLSSTSKYNRDLLKETRTQHGASRISLWQEAGSYKDFQLRTLGLNRDLRRLVLNGAINLKLAEEISLLFWGCVNSKECARRGGPLGEGNISVALGDVITIHYYTWRQWSHYQSFHVWGDENEFYDDGDKAPRSKYTGLVTRITSTSVKLFASDVGIVWFLRERIKFCEVEKTDSTERRPSGHFPLTSSYLSFYAGGIFAGVGGGGGGGGGGVTPPQAASSELAPREHPDWSKHAKIIVEGLMETSRYNYNSSRGSAYYGKGRSLDDLRAFNGRGLDDLITWIKLMQMMRMIVLPGPGAACNAGARVEVWPGDAVKLELYTTYHFEIEGVIDRIFDDDDGGWPLLRHNRCIALKKDNGVTIYFPVRHIRKVTAIRKETDPPEAAAGDSVNESKASCRIM